MHCRSACAQLMDMVLNFAHGRSCLHRRTQWLWGLHCVWWHKRRQHVVTVWQLTRDVIAACIASGHTRDDRRVGAVV